MCKAEKILDGLNPTSLYHPSVFLWLPHLLDTSSVITCPNSTCNWYKNINHPMTIKGWNDDPIARCIVGLDRIYYIMTMRSNAGPEMISLHWVDVEDHTIFMILLCWSSLILD
jgi:hypothetical protein